MGLGGAVCGIVSSEARGQATGAVRIGGAAFASDTKSPRSCLDGRAFAKLGTIVDVSEIPFGKAFSADASPALGRGRTDTGE
jgi:hypothetical protein